MVRLSPLLLLGKGFAGLNCGVARERQELYLAVKLGLMPNLFLGNSWEKGVNPHFQPSSDNPCKPKLTADFMISKILSKLEI